MKRRAFLAALGLAPVAAVAQALPIEPALKLGSDSDLATPVTSGKLIASKAITASRVTIGSIATEKLAVDSMTADYCPGRSPVVC